MAMASNAEKGDSGGGPAVSPDKLMEKYKQALSIAQKAKTARDEAIKDNKLLVHENESLKEKVKTLENKYGTAEEMLAALTQQKLKFAMEIDDLKKQKAVFIEELTSKETSDIESESFKRQYNRLLKENEELITKFGSAESDSLQLRKEFNELQKENDDLRQKYSNIQSEKEDLDKSFKETLERLCLMEQNQNILNSVLSKKFNNNVNDFSEWTHIIEIFDNKSFNDEGLKNEIESLKAEKEKYNHSLGLLMKDKENLEQENVDLNQTIRNIREELEIANSDRDKMMINLEKVGLETKQLIENSEKLTDEIEILKEEKIKQDQVMTFLQKDKEELSKVAQESEMELTRISAEFSKCQRLNEELMLKIKSYESSSPSDDLISFSGKLSDATNHFEEKSPSVQVKECSGAVLLTEERDGTTEMPMKKEESVNSELNQLQEELQAFSCEIVKYKKIADENEQKYLNAFEELAMIKNELKQKYMTIEEFEEKVKIFEEQKQTLTNNLSQCKTQLLSALEDLSQAEEVKNKLKIESENKEQKINLILEELKGKDIIISEKLLEVQNLLQELAKTKSILDEKSIKWQESDVEKDNKLKSLTEEINELKDSIEKIIQEDKLKLEEHKKEIKLLKEEIAESQKHNKNLTSENSNLNKQVKEILNEQANENNNLVKKLTCLQESLQAQVTEKQVVISGLEKEISDLTSNISSLNEQNQGIVSENNDLKSKFESLKLSSSEEVSTLNKQNAELQEKLNGQIALLADKNTTLADLKNELIKVKDEINKNQENSSQESNKLNEIISSTTLSLMEINKNIIIDIKLLKKDSTMIDSDELTENQSLIPEFLVNLSNKLRENHIVMHEEISTVLNAYEGLVYENSTLKSQIKILNDEFSQMSELQANFEEAVKKLESQSKMIEELEKEKSDLIKEAGEMLSSNSTLKSTLDQLNNDHLKLKENYTILEDQHEKETARKLETKSTVIDGLEKEKTCLAKQTEELSATNETLKSRLDQLNQEYLTLKAQFAELEIELERHFGNKKEENDQHNIIVNNLKKIIESLKKREIDAEKEIIDGKTTIDDLNKRNISLIEEIEVLKKEIHDKENLGKESYLEEMKKMKEKIEELSSINAALTQNLSSFEEKIVSMRTEQSEEKNKLTDSVHKIQEELKNCQELLEFKKTELKENNRIWAGRFSSLKIALIGLNKSRKEIRNHFESLESLFASFMRQIQEPLQEKVDMVIQDSLSSAKHELIAEMHLMNQALKERGESISKLEFSVSEHQSKQKQLNNLNENLKSELQQVQTHLKALEENVKDKDSYIKQLEEEIEQLKESHDNNTDNDVLSTSTISRTEEHSRLKDIEDSFEDRYTKLKLLAVKMKKRIGELTQTLETERSKMSVERNELHEKISSMSMAVKNAQKLQELFDQSLDERDELKKKTKALENSLEDYKNSEESLKDKITSLESSNQSIPVMKKHIDSLNAVIKDSKSEIQKLQMENKAENIKYEELKKTNSKLEAKLQELTSSLEQAKQQGKSNNVLELEIKNYEKIIADLSSQLNAEKNNIKSLQADNEAVKNVKVGLEEQLTILEKQMKVEEERNLHTNEQLNNARKKLDELSSQTERLNREIENLQKELTSEKHKNDALTLEMSQITSDFSKKEILMNSRIVALQEEIRTSESSLAATKQELFTSKNEINHLHEEYESYKLRAQTILAKKKGEFVTHEEKEAKEEVERLKKECKLLEEKIDAYISEIDTLNTRLSSLMLEKARSDKKYEEMKQALHQKIHDFDLLNIEYHNFKITSESSIENLKDEMQKRKNEYHSELSQQRKIIDELTLEFQLKEESLQQSREKNDNPGYVSGFQESIPLPLEREDGEGSESVPSPKTRRHSSLVPLDILLNNPIVDENKVIVLQEQVEKLRRELTSFEVRCRHLSSLLSESERDSARNQQQNKILKEEVRRLERSLERHPHVANTEYLKNVVFKFVTLPHGDERSRLVPVMETLLKLSPEEIHRLNGVARGESQAGWGSYLHSWTGL